MDGLNIDAGDLEFMAKSDEMLGDDIKKIDIGPPLEKDARDAIPGSSSEKHIPEVVSAIKKRHQDLADNYHDFSDRVKQTSLD